MRFRSVLAWVPVAALFAACGSDDSEGDGTGAKTTCAAGATQACTCNGSDTGVQVCAADGKSWGACSCGASGGSGGVAGSGNASGGTGAIGGGSGGSGGNDASTGGASGGGAGGMAGQDGSTGDAGSDAGTVWQDEPCSDNKPFSPSYMDCEGDCFIPVSGQLNCANAKCTTAYHFTNDEDGFPIRVRLPSKPGIDATCVAQCGTGNTTFGVGVSIGNGVLGPIKVTVAKPWKIAFHDNQFAIPTHFCMDGSETTECALKPFSGYQVFFLTDDPNAPAVNALIELAGDSGSCP